MIYSSQKFFGNGVFICPASSLVSKCHGDVKTKCTRLEVWMNCVDNCGILMDMMLFVLAESCKNDPGGAYCQQLCQCTGKLPWQLDWIQAQAPRMLLNPHIVSREAEWHFLGRSSRKQRERKSRPPSRLLCTAHPPLLLFLKNQRADCLKDLASLWLDSDRRPAWVALVVSPGVVRDWVRVLSLNVCVMDTSLLVFCWIVLGAIKSGTMGFIAWD